MKDDEWTVTYNLGLKRGMSKKAAAERSTVLNAGKTIIEYTPTGAYCVTNNIHHLTLEDAVKYDRYKLTDVDIALMKLTGNFKVVT